MHQAISHAIDAISDAVDALDSAEPNPADYSDAYSYMRDAARNHMRWIELAEIAEQLARLAADERELCH